MHWSYVLLYQYLSVCNHEIGILHAWLICEISPGASRNCTPVVNCWIVSLSWLKMVQSFRVTWKIDRWVVKLHEPFTEYVNIGKPSLYSHIMKPPIHHCPVEKGFATSCFLWNIIWGQQFFHVRNSNSMHQILAKIQIHMQSQGHVYNLLFPMIYCDCHGCKFLLDLAVLGYKPISHAFG